MALVALSVADGPGGVECRLAEACASTAAEEAGNQNVSNRGTPNMGVVLLLGFCFDQPQKVYTENTHTHMHPLSLKRCSHHEHLFSLKQFMRT